MVVSLFPASAPIGRGCDFRYNSFIKSAALKRPKARLSSCRGFGVFVSFFIALPLFFCFDYTTARIFFGGPF